MSYLKKKANVQSKMLKDLQKSWRTIAEEHFYKSLAPWKKNIKR